MKRRPFGSSTSRMRICSSRDGRAEVILGQAAEAAVPGGATWAGVVARSERALLALERGDLAAVDRE